MDPITWNSLQQTSASDQKLKVFCTGYYMLCKLTIRNRAKTTKTGTERCLCTLSTVTHQSRCLTMDLRYDVVFQSCHQCIIICVVKLPEWTRFNLIWLFLDLFCERYNGLVNVCFKSIWENICHIFCNWEFSLRFLSQVFYIKNEVTERRKETE